MPTMVAVDPFTPPLLASVWLVVLFCGAVVAGVVVVALDGGVVLGCVVLGCVVVLDGALVVVVEAGKEPVGVSGMCSESQLIDPPRERGKRPTSGMCGPAENAITYVPMLGGVGLGHGSGDWRREGSAR